MKNLSILSAGFVTAIIAIMFLPPFVIYLFGCYQIGSWIGEFLHDKMD